MPHSSPLPQGKRDSLKGAPPHKKSASTRRLPASWEEGSGVKEINRDATRFRLMAPFCRNRRLPSQQTETENAKKVAGVRFPPYLCIVNQNKRHLSDRTKQMFNNSKFIRL